MHITQHKYSIIFVFYFVIFGAYVFDEDVGNFMHTVRGGSCLMMWPGNIPKRKERACRPEKGIKRFRCSALASSLSSLSPLPQLYISSSLRIVNIAIFTYGIRPGEHIFVRNF